MSTRIARRSAALVTAGVLAVGVIAPAGSAQYGGPILPNPAKRCKKKGAAKHVKKHGKRCKKKGARR